MTTENRAQTSNFSSRQRAAGSGFSRSTPVGISADERRRMIALNAYYRAADRGFQGGDPVRDWLEAEAEIDAHPVRAADEGKERPRAAR